MEMSAPAERASMKALVPDLAIVPKFLTKSALIMPIPLKKNRTVKFVFKEEEPNFSTYIYMRVRLQSSLLGTILILRSLPLSNLLGSVRDS